MQAIREALQKTIELLKLEKEADFEQFKAMVESLPLRDRLEKGFTWHPVQIVKSGYTYGDRAFVIVERPLGQEGPHQFRSGTTVRLFTLESEKGMRERNGVVNFVERRRMKIILNSKDLPSWASFGPLGVDLLFDERTYLEMERAMQQVLNAPQGRLADLRDILGGGLSPRFEPLAHSVDIPSLNPSQNAAVNRILASQDVAVVHGPPGTGKTTTLVQAIKILAEREGTVLVSAPSNTAVDLLTERLAAEDLLVVRIGNISRVDEQIIRHTLEGRLGEHPESKNIKKVKIQAADYRRQAKRFRRNFGAAEQRERRQLFQQAGELEAWANQLEDRLIDQILSSAQVITCTLIGAAHKVLDKRKFRTVVIDEAAQALEPANWVPILRAGKVVLAGDPFQLPPTVKSPEAQRNGFNVTLLEKCLHYGFDVSLLNIQYRMHHAIMGFSNEQFYGGILQAAEAVRDHRLPIDQAASVVFIDTAGCGFEEQLNEEYQSRYNPEEFHILCEHLYQLTEWLGEHPLPSFALISPYREQVVHMETAIREDDRLEKLPLAINTIDGFQGQEKDVVYISLVRSNREGQIGFLSDYRRMNVAMTRARKLLVVVGDSATIGGHSFYQAFLDYVDRKGAYQTAWEFMR